MSKTSLKSLLLNRLNILSNVRRECRYYKQRLQDARDEQRTARIELEQINFALEQHNVILFPPQVKIEEQPTVHRVFDRWGGVSFEPIQPAGDRRKKNAS